MKNIASELNTARDIAVNYALIEQEEMAVDMDGRQHFESAISKAMQEDEVEARAALAQMKPFSTTSWKVPHPEATGGRITWPWNVS